MPQNEIAGLICDLDGTLVDTEKHHVQAWAEIFGKYGLSMTKGWEARYIGASDDTLAELIIRKFDLPVSVEELLRERHDLYRELVTRGKDQLLFPGVAEELEALKALGVKMAVGTNSPMENTIVPLMLTGIESFFSTLVTFGMSERPKPDPEIFLIAAERIGVAPERCAIVEDTPVGVQAGRNAGGTVLGLTTTNPPEIMKNADILFPETRLALRWAREHYVAP